MKQIEVGKYENYPVGQCERCLNNGLELHYQTDGGFRLCDSCYYKMIFDREHPTD